MRSFECRVCGNDLFFENSLCVSCGSALGYARAERAIVPVDADGRYVDADGLVWWVCRNLNLSGCTWLAELEGGACFSCTLTRTRPNDADASGYVAFGEAERAKRHLVAELDDLGFTLRSKSEDPVNGLAFDLLSSALGEVRMGHDRGVITINVSESDPALRETVRVTLDEPYRTMLGHFRHEMGHYVEWQHVRGELVEQCRQVFGDEQASYQEAIDRYYAEGPPPGWESDYISTYATMHPFEDFAETFAHFLHIRDTIDTAARRGLVGADLRQFDSFSQLVRAVWIPLALALNQINRSMGRDDLYPFVIPPVVLGKLDFVARLMDRAAGVD
jgi:hypothetical protein